jgi:predicted ribosome quality control (RQC) complex YloA/Tae2 family protein
MRSSGGRAGSRKGLAWRERAWEDTEKALASLALVAQALAAPEGHEIDVDALQARARTAAPRDFTLPSAPAPGRKRGASLQEPAPPFRTYLSTSGARILVGRSAEKNDALTLHVARPRDLWLHTKGHTGAHVVVPLAKGASCPSDLLVEAAHLAAHFSDAKHETVTEIQYTPRRYVRKPRGSPPGLVVVDREKVMILRRDEALLRRLLDREQKD